MASLMAAPYRRISTRTRFLQRLPRSISNFHWVGSESTHKTLKPGTLSRDSCVYISKTKHSNYDAVRACYEGVDGGKETRGSLFTPKSEEDLQTLTELLDENANGFHLGMYVAQWRVYSGQMEWMRNRSKEAAIASFPSQFKEE